jgi:hypothetical protein
VERFVTWEELQLVPELQTQVIVTTFNIVFDESGKKDRSHVVYAGLLFDQGEAWSEFSRQWRVLLYPHGISFFHSKEAFRFEGDWKQFQGKRQTEGENLIRSLATLSNEFPREAFGSIISSDGFKKLGNQQRARYQNDPFYVAFEEGILAAVKHADILPDDNFNLICDDSEEHASECIRVYRRFVKNWPDVGKKLGTICFGDDEKIVPLQMADMFAYCLRKKAEGGPDGLWTEVLKIFMEHEDAKGPVTFRPVTVFHESPWMLFRRRFRLWLRDGRRLFRR